MSFETTQDILIRLLTVLIVATTLMVADTGLGDAHVSSDMLTITEQRSTSDDFAPGKYVLHAPEELALDTTGCPACPDDGFAPTTAVPSGSVDLIQRAADLPHAMPLIQTEQARHEILSDRHTIATLLPPVTPPPRLRLT